MIKKIKINPDLDPEEFSKIYDRIGRVNIPNILTEESAQLIYDALVHEVPWQTNFNDGEKGHTLHEVQVDALKDTQRDLLLTHINEKAKHGFQYVYNSYSLSDARAQGLNQDLFINSVLDFVNTEEFLSFVRAVTGGHDGKHIDSQCTLYRPGHFLSDHSDDVGGKHRLAAMVLNFTPNWRVDWGGILQFIDSNENVSQGITPSFNALNLLKVPQKHSVSYVVPHAVGGRYSITGWLRTDSPDSL